MSLPDGIYLVPVHTGSIEPRFVKDGQYGYLYPNGYWRDLPDDTSDWTRIRDLPRMNQPDQIGYPVMAGCLASSSPHLHLSIAGLDYPWYCRTAMFQRWANLSDPRDLTPEEIAEYNLWTPTERGPRHE